MKVNRNEPCPCGSGKKYKKCCLKKDNIVQLGEVKEERFLQERHELVLKINSFIDKEIPSNQMFQLHTEFRNRSQYMLKDSTHKGFFQYWLNFFHTYENGLRGIEWFLQETSSHLTIKEKTLAESWAKLTPKVVQAVGITDENILFEDVITKERYKILNKGDNANAFAPWYGTISVIEPYGDHDYFNGVRAFEGPKNISQVQKYIQHLTSETNLDHEQVLFHYYPEIMAEFLKDPRKSDKERMGKEIHNYTIQYQVKDEETVLNFLQQEEEFVIDVWQLNDKQLSWLSNWKEYMDNEMDGVAQLADNLGTISLEKNHLQFNCFNKDIVDQFKMKVSRVQDAVVFIDEKVQSHIIPYTAEMKNMAVHFSQDVPQYFALYAQNDWQHEIEQPLPIFENLSARELVENGRSEEVDTWLKQHEYRLYHHAKHENGIVEITADFNTVRKELGLALSPFVTGGENRSSSINPTNKSDHRVYVEKADIPFYESLGFTPDTIDHYYTKSFIQFFKEKVEGKSENTMRKYRNSLYDLREILENYQVNNWDDLKQKQWEKIITKNYFDMFDAVSKTQVKEFISTLKSFAKWLDAKESTSLSGELIKAIDKTEKKRLELAGV